MFTLVGVLTGDPVSDFLAALDEFEDALESESVSGETLNILWGLIDLVRAEHERAEELEQALDLAVRTAVIGSTN